MPAFLLKFLSPKVFAGFGGLLIVSAIFLWTYNLGYDSGSAEAKLDCKTQAEELQKEMAAKIQKALDKQEALYQEELKAYQLRLQASRDRNVEDRIELSRTLKYLEEIEGRFNRLQREAQIVDVGSCTLSEDFVRLYNEVILTANGSGPPIG